MRNNNEATEQAQKLEIENVEFKIPNPDMIKAETLGIHMINSSLKLSKTKFIGPG